MDATHTIATSPGNSWLKIGCAAIVAACLVGAALVIPRHEHAEWYAKLEERILSLAPRRPDGVSPEVWAFYIRHAWDFHAGYGIYENFDPKAREAFLAEFDRRLAGKVGPETIDWIFDQYVEHSHGAAQDAPFWRPTGPEKLRDFANGKFGDPRDYELQHWIDKCHERQMGRP